MNTVQKMVLKHIAGQLGPVLFGFVFWLALVVVYHPSVFAVRWGHLVLVLGPLVLIPLGLPTYRGAKAKGWMKPIWLLAEKGVLPCAVLFAIGYILEPSWVSVLFVLPWLLLTICLGVLGAGRFLTHPRGPVREWCLDFALLFLVVGAVWALFDRLQYRPLDFDAVIVLLTAIHFHYGGFALPLLTGVVLQEEKSKLASGAALGVLVGFPLVAIGITAAQLGGGAVMEIVPVWVLGVSGVGIAILLGRQALHAGTYTRVFWLIASVCLGASMLLAIVYGSRGVFDVSGLDIPWMRALHGTANALGFAFCGLVGLRIRQLIGM